MGQYTFNSRVESGEGLLGIESGRYSASNIATSITVIIPTLNEEQTIGQLIDKVRVQKLSSSLSILVIDGGSTDRTVQICKDKDVNVLSQKGKGKGSAMREAVSQTSAEIVVFIDGDGTYSADSLASLVFPLLEDKADMVVGSRNQELREKGSILKFNAVGNKLFNKAINFAMNSVVTDSLSGYRALRRETFNELVLLSDKFEIEIEITVEAIAKGLRVIEVPVSYEKRKGSKTKLNPWSDGMIIARSLLFILMNVTPLKFFAIISLVFFALALYPAFFVVHEKFTIGEVISIPSVLLSSLLFVASALSVVVGLLSELVVRSRRRMEYMINKYSNMSKSKN